MKSIFAAALFVVLAGAEAHAQAAASTGPRTTDSGVFTSDQAKAGERAYQASCAACHGLNLRKTDPEAPDLTDSPFRFGWQGKTLAERLDRIRTTMPRGSPRSLDDRTYLEIVTYILQFNGVPTGAEPLPSDTKTLEQIVISVPAPVAAPGASSGRRR